MKACCDRWPPSGGALKKMIKVKKFPFEVYFHFVKVNFAWQGSFKYGKKQFKDYRLHIRNFYLILCICQWSKGFSFDLYSKNFSSFLAKIVSLWELHNPWEPFHKKQLVVLIKVQYGINLLIQCKLLNVM